MKEISALTKEPPESSLFPSTMRGHSGKTTLCEPGNRLSPDTESAGTLNLDFPAPTTVRNKYLLCINHPTYVILL